MGRGTGDHPEAAPGVLKPVRLSAEAVDELAEAAAWYHRQREGLELEFVAEVNRVLQVLGASPAAFAKVLGVPEELGIRRALLHRFPYALVFTELETEVRIVAAAHAKRRPGYWLSRIRS